MKTIKLAKADPLQGTDPQPTTIVIDSQIPNDPTFDVEIYYYKQAEELTKALIECLPQGTLDRMLVTLMKRKVSLYRGLMIS